jgi:hypothetical protein
MFPDSLPKIAARWPTEHKNSQGRAARVNSGGFDSSSGALSRRAAKTKKQQNPAARTAHSVGDTDFPLAIRPSGETPRFRGCFFIAAARQSL